MRRYVHVRCVGSNGYIGPSRWESRQEWTYCPSCKSTEIEKENEMSKEQTPTLTLQTPNSPQGWASIAALLIALAPQILQISVAIADAFDQQPHTVIQVGGK